MSTLIAAQLGYSHLRYAEYVSKLCSMILRARRIKESCCDITRGDIPEWMFSTGVYTWLFKNGGRVSTVNIERINYFPRDYLWGEGYVNEITTTWHTHPSNDSFSLIYKRNDTITDSARIPFEVYEAVINEYDIDIYEPTLSIPPLIGSTTLQDWLERDIVHIKACQEVDQQRWIDMSVQEGKAFIPQK